MSFRVQCYDAFSGLGPGERIALVNFIHRSSEEEDRGVIREAIDYALKNKPSFGGFIFVCWQERRPIACVLVNKTGMSGFLPSHLLVYASLDKEFHGQPEILDDLVRKTTRRCKGEVALHLKPDSPSLPLFQALGFQEHYVELRFNNQVSLSSAS